MKREREWMLICLAGKKHKCEGNGQSPAKHAGDCAGIIESGDEMLEILWTEGEEATTTRHSQPCGWEYFVQPLSTEREVPVPDGERTVCIDTDERHPPNPYDEDVREPLDTGDSDERRRGAPETGSENPATPERSGEEDTGKAVEG